MQESKRNRKKVLQPLYMLSVMVSVPLIYSYFIITPDMWQSKTIILSMNMDKNR